MVNETAHRGVKEIILMIPSFIKMLYRLLGDKRVLLQEKALLLATIAYVFSPLDFLPDVIPFLGQVDDLFLVALVLKRFMNSVERSLLFEYWDGNDDLLLTIDRILEYAGIFLPKGVYEKVVKAAR